MAANKPEENSPFPKPSEYAKNYTTEAIKSGRVLAPPPIPTQYEVFGENYDLEEDLVIPLKTLGIQAYSTTGLTWREEFKKMNASVIVNFLDLLQILINSPDSPERNQKIEAIRLLFINMHHMVNEYRPVQARTTLSVMLDHQNKEMQKLTDDIRKLLYRGSDVVNQTLLNVQETPAIPRPNTPGGARIEDLVRRDDEVTLDILRTEQELVELMERFMTPREGLKPETDSAVPDIPLKYPIDEEEGMVPM
uniref:Mediator of RNA polymerase II transcription subunit 7 n=1 Tax=Steinernema glaseri TaxID=37863 RepID=A0A1I7ZBD4_9BILA